MNKKELILEVTKSTAIDEKTVEKVINSLFEIIKNKIIEGDRVEIRGFGSFKKVARQARIAYNPRNRKEIKIDAKYVAQFKPGRELKETLERQKP